MSDGTSRTGPESGGNPTEPIPRISLVEQTVRRIKKMIIGRELKPGDRLREVALATAFDIGHPTIREALIKLENEGFVTRVSNRGTFVTTLTEKQVKDIYDIRERLETLAFIRARKRITADALAQVERVLRTMKEAAEANDHIAYYEADAAFHRMIAELPGNEYLAKLLNTLSAPSLAYSVAVWETGERAAGADWHRQLANCLTQGSEEEVVATVRKAHAFFRDHILTRISATEIGTAIND